MVGSQKNEINRAVEKFLADLKSSFKNSTYIKSRSFCLKILTSTTQLFRLEFNRRRHLEIFRWIHDILLVQFSEMKITNKNEITENKMDDSDNEDIDVEGQNSNSHFGSICSEILLFILICLKEEDEEIKESALKINNLLQQEMVLIFTKQDTDSQNNVIANFENPLEGYKGSDSYPQIFEFLKNMISNNSNSKIVFYAMKWIDHLLDYFPKELVQLNSQIIQNLHHKDIQIVEISVIFIAKCVNKQNNYEMIQQISEFIENHLNSSNDQSKILSILKILFVHIEGEKIILYFVQALLKNHNNEFKSSMVQNLDMVINIQPNLKDLRVKLRNKNDELFKQLFKLWIIEPISCISLCLLSQRYKLANKIIQILSIFSIEMSSLIHLSQIVKLFDMPHYSYVRMQLLHPDKFPYLITSLKGIMMLLPQGKAFDSLKNRLECSSILKDIVTHNDQDEKKKIADGKDMSDAQVEELLELFKNENRNKFGEEWEYFEMIN